MNRREFVVSTLGGVVSLSGISRAAGQAAAITPDLAALVDAKTLRLFNRGASRVVDGSRNGVRLSEEPGDGVAFLPDIEFGSGTIAFDVRGKDIVQQSFVGVAFHGVDAVTYDGIYFRPFNFSAADPARRSRAVQYHSLPVHPWEKLRTEHPGRYEQAVTPVPDPNAWFRARVVVASPTVSVFIGDATQPCLVVNQLSDRRRGLVGLWVGNNSGGDFANMTVVPGG